MTKLNDADFKEWFRGFTDAEGSFIITPNNKGANFLFKFAISLHIDDLNVLTFIRDSLSLGSVKEYPDHGYATYSVTTQKEVLEIINLFDSQSLNTIKHLNFLAFKKAFQLYKKSKMSDALVSEINAIRSNMNLSRTEFDSTLPSPHITPNWLLGFVEGEGSFFVKKGKNFPIGFSIGQSSSELALLQKIREFILALPGDYTASRNNSNVVGVYTGKAVNNAKAMSHIAIRDPMFIKNVLIPFFDSLVFHSKKGLDYNDWKTVLTLKEEGKHFTELGEKVIEGFIGRMNNNRLSTNKAEGLASYLEGEFLNDLNHLLSLPSNLEVHSNGKIFIISQGKYYNTGNNLAVQLVDSNDLVIREFDSVTDCSKFLELSKNTISRRLASRKPIEWNGQTVYVVPGNTLSN